MSWDKNKRISQEEISEKITPKTVQFAEEFGKYLATGVNAGKEQIVALTTSQLRKFFGEVKRQQMSEFNESEFAMLKPKLAYAVGRAHQRARATYKIDDFYEVMADCIDKVCKSPDKQKAFKNFTLIFEAIVAYHKAAEK